MSTDIQTEITPPEVNEDGDGDNRSGRLVVHWLGVDDVSYETAVQLFADNAESPAEFADALLRSALALAALVGPEQSWAVMQRLASYDGMQR